MQSDRLPYLVALAFAGAFLLATIIGFVPNPLVGEDALFHTNTAHNLVHLLTAIGFVVFALLGNRASILFMKWFGVVYLSVGVLGFFVIGDGGYGYLFGLVHINTLDNYLHLALGTTILLAGLYLGRRGVGSERILAAQVVG